MTLLMQFGVNTRILHGLHGSGRTRTFKLSRLQTLGPSRLCHDKLNRCQLLSRSDPICFSGLLIRIASLVENW